jgi:predicted membrane-bound spermidine synthase
MDPSETNFPGRATLVSQSKFYIGLFLITACTLMLQVIQTRILSVVAWYHLAFFAISMAMFGLTVGAVWVYLRRDRFTDKTLSYDLSYFSMAFALSTLFCLIVQMSLTPIVSRSMTSILTWAELAICLSIPFFFSGVVVSLALTRSPFPVGRVYGADLLGAAVGCLGVLVLLNNTDGPSAVLWVGAIAAVGAFFFSKSGIGGEPQTKPPLDVFVRHRTTIFVLVVICAVLNGLSDYGLQPLVAKGKFEAGNTYDFREWNTFSRVAVYPPFIRKPQMWAASPKMPESLEIEQRYIDIDAIAGTTAYRFTGNLKQVEFLKYDVTTLAYYLPNRERAVVIGIGGGRDMLSAAIFGLPDITGVEINPILVKLLTDKPGFADFANVSTLNGVRFVIDEGRSWLARTQQRFDVIQMSLIDTWAATGAGAFSLSENGLYTVEAWRIFLSRLTTRGVFTVSRWYYAEDPTETGRILSLAVAALFEIGIGNPKNHIFLATQGSIATLILSRTPFSSKDLAALNDAVTYFQHNILASPTLPGTSETLNRILAAKDSEDLQQYTSNLSFDLTPATDDRPFFFNQLPLTKPAQAFYLAKEMVATDTHLGGVRAGNLVATATLIILFAISLGLVVVSILIPLRHAVRDVGGRLVVGGTLYFLLIGIGFMMIEIGLLQRMSIFLGHPVYSLSVLLFTLILATGIGSLVSDILPLDSRPRFLIWALFTGAYVAALPHWLSSVFLAFDGTGLLTRAILCVITIAPAGLLLGFGFPTGMRLISAIDRRPTPWFWGVNGAAGTLASTVAVASSIAFGIGTTLTIGATCYVLLIPTVLLCISPGKRETG